MVSLSLTLLWCCDLSLCLCKLCSLLWQCHHMLVISIQIGIDSAEWMILWDVWGGSSKHGLNALTFLVH